ncbi:hypothetical protein CDD82_7090 [Ophiocordyceps australis]|uniref:Uncharacterized protein n=1 Tax=Ophiocordyceps australis TaxID=1399860 RepID=A0A2C5YU83_9HYPO|nr:hypothetical protein CDD82_7090 [Ophiocordyceps australis]
MTSMAAPPKEWQVSQPHRDFSFARHVKGNALISIVNRGLLYYALEREFALTQLPNDAVAKAEKFRVGVFGPLDVPTKPVQIQGERTTTATNDKSLVPQPPKALEPGQAATESTPISQDSASALIPPPLNDYADDVEESLKRRPQHQALNASPSKRSRLSNGLDTPIDPAPPGAGIISTSTPAATTGSIPPSLNTSTTPMDIDVPSLAQPEISPPEASTNHAYPSPLEGEQLILPVSQTDGPEQGTQVEKVEELLPETTFLRLADEDSTSSDAEVGAHATPSPSSAGPRSEAGPVLLQCEWNPKDPSVLAAAGTDALARVWTVSRSAVPQDGTSPQARSLLDPETPKSATVTALAWAPDGTAIATALDLGNHAAVSIWSGNGNHVHTMEIDEAPVISVCWNMSNSALLALSPSKNGALVSIFVPSKQVLSHHLPGHDISSTPLDAAWTSDSEFLLCGGDVFLCLCLTPSGIVQVRKFETKDDDSFTRVLYDERTKLAATSSDKGTLDLWDESGQRRSITAHQGAITSMAWQPLPSLHTHVDDERLIATGGDDCAILIWNARKPESKVRCFLTMETPIVGLAFTPDGIFIAGATSRKVLIWKVDSHNIPRASWNRPSHMGWLSPRGSSDSDEEDEHCLCWDMSGRQLAFGASGKLAVINFSR